MIIDAWGRRMHVADLGTKGPFFLEELAHQKVLSWASGPTSDCRSESSEKLLVLTGPAKSGKTALLKILLRVVAARFKKEADRRYPVGLDFAFTLGERPQEAALSLCEAAAAAAKDIGFEISLVPTDGEGALADIARVMQDLAKGIHAAGGELILLLDEVQVSGSIRVPHRKHDSAAETATVRTMSLSPCVILFRFDPSLLQAPMMAADTLHDAGRFASKLKDVYTACHDTSRVAITGSGTMSLLNFLRSIEPNGHTQWGTMARVQLGATPNRHAAMAMAKAIIGFRSTHWGEEARARITHKVVLRLLGLEPDANLKEACAGSTNADAELLWSDFSSKRSQRLTAPRPALVAYLADLMRSADVGTAEAIVDAAMKELLDKIREEVLTDAVKALATLTVEQRKLVYKP